MGARTLRLVGETEPFQFRIDMRTVRASVVFFIPMMIEGWCLSHCGGSWRMDPAPDTVVLTFDEPADAVHFKMSDEYDLIKSA